MKKLFILLSLLFSLSMGQDYSLSFDGEDDCVTIPKLFSGEHSDYTINIWVKASIQNQGTIFHHLAAYGDVVASINDINFIFRIYSGNGTQQNSVINIDFTPYENNWTYISLVSENFNGSSHKLYINGILVESKDGIGKDWNTGYVMTGIGCSYNYDNTPNPDTFEGQIARFETWNYSLTQEEIISTMYASLLGDENGLIRYYKINEGVDDIIYDHSGNGNHGTINGATWVCNDMDVCGVCGGDNSTCPTIQDFDGNEYATVEIGNQTWMRQNLKVTHYNDGSEIPTGYTDGDWESLYSGAYAISEDGINSVFYNWYAVDDARGICPAGWHTPNSLEYDELIQSFEGLAEPLMDDSTWIGTNESGFTAIQTGYFHFGGYYNNSLGAYFWSSTEIDNEESKSFGIISGENNVYDWHDDKNYGFSVRCIQDDIEGCTNPNAANYDETANVDDGSCEYETVQIGHQVWISENLKATHYRNGDAIPTGLDNDTWSSTTEGAYAVYDDDPANAEIYGNLYNWYAVDDERGICPDDFHIPSDDEWKILEKYLGMSQEEANGTEFRGTNQGSKIVGNIDDWVDGDLVNDEEFGISNFNALPSGFRFANGEFSGLSNTSYYWSSTSHTSGASKSRRIISDFKQVGRYYDSNNAGFTVRCLSNETQTTTIVVPENFATIQEAIDYSMDGDTILVSAGTYYENIVFENKNLVVLGESSDSTIIDGSVNGSTVMFQGFNYPFTIDSTFVLSNFTIQNGSIENDGGGGIYCKKSSPTLSNLIIKNNYSGHEGGGLWFDISNSKLINIIVENNESAFEGGGVHIQNICNMYLEDVQIINNTSGEFGGGLYIEDNSYLNVINSQISDNVSSNSGGGIYINNSNMILLNTIISHNIAGVDGGGLHVTSSLSDNSNSNLIIIYSEISNNETGDNGGGIYAYASHVNLKNSTLTRNIAHANNGYYVGGGAIYISINSDIEINNSILWSNVGQEIFFDNYQAYLALEYSNVEGGANGISNTQGQGIIDWAATNIEAAPMFTDSENGDFTLQPSSPCIDAGDPDVDGDDADYTTDIDDRDPDGTRADMGAYPFFQIPGCIDSLATNFDEEANINDGSCTYPDNGDYSLSFDGVDDYVRNDSEHNVSGNHSFTIATSFYANDINNTFSSLVSLGDNSNNARDENSLVISETNVIRWNNQIALNDCYGTTILNSNQWYSAIATYDSETRNVYIYLNGQLENSCIIDEANFYSTGITIGARTRFGGSQTDAYFNGIVDNVLVLDDYIEEASFEDILGSDFVGLEIASYKFNAGEGNILYDHSGNSNHGTIHGATWAGCTDESACNYVDSEVEDDESCWYAEEYYDCDGNCMAELDCNDECGGVAIEDCNGLCDGDAEVDDCSVCAGDNSTCCTDIAADEYFVGSPAICEYTDTLVLHEGANLVSFWVLPDNSSLSPMFDSIYDTIDGIIGEGVAASPNPVPGWVGSLQAIDPLDGYWLKVNEDIFFTFTGTQLTPSDTPYELHSGANLISFPYMGECAITDAIPDEFEPYMVGIISEGVAASPNPVLGWVGSLTAFQGGKGYWMKTNADIVDFNFDISNCSNSLARSNDITIAEDFNQSTQQAFYFIEDIEKIQLGDIVSSYCNDTKVGSREWMGAYTDIPAMGNDNSDLTKDYCTSNQTPTFRVEKPSGATYKLTGDIPLWESNGLHMLSSLQEAIILPERYSLAAAYPNPFNPTTTINFAIPTNAEVSISVYNLQGREVVTLASGSYDAGYHSVIWNADTHSSGVYFVKMVAGSYVNTQKLMLVK